VIVVAGLATQPAGQEPSWLKATGVEWAQMSPEARQAYTAGFLAGGALAQALDQGARDSLGIAQALDSLGREGYRFPYGVNVYTARINDYYWWENHRSLPIWNAFQEVNNDLKRSTQQGSP
jgi:ABC-type sugar transport system substrate-binding protein